MPGTLTLAGIALGLAGATVPGTDRPTLRVGDAPGLLGPAVLVLAALLIPWVVLRADRQLRGSYWLGQGERALGRGDPLEAARRALPHLERARAATPHDFRIDLRLALALFRTDRPAEAAAAARRALTREPHSPNAWTVLAAAQLAQGQAAAARANAGHALTLLADYPLALSVAARSAEATGAPATDLWTRLRRLTDPSIAGPDTAEAARALLPRR
jgi:tetratricopeptide (TPR) repeat protein